MLSRCLSCVMLGFVVYPIMARPLRICSDPDNLPFSSRRADGFDNRIAVLIAKDIRREPLFVWARSRRGFLREEFDKNACDVLMSAPLGLRGVATTAPYYRSSYMFVTRSSEGLRISSFADHRLNHGRIGLQILETDMSPPAVPLARYGHTQQLIGFDSFGAASADILQAVVEGRVGVSVVWGPTAGYYVAKLQFPCTLTPVSPDPDLFGIPFQYSLTLAVHKDDVHLRDELNRSLQRLQPRIDHILATYHVPTLPISGGRQ